MFKDISLCSSVRYLPISQQQLHILSHHTSTIAHNKTWKQEEWDQAGHQTAKVKCVPAFPASDDQGKMFGACDLWPPRHKTRDRGRAIGWFATFASRSDGRESLDPGEKTNKKKKQTTRLVQTINFPSRREWSEQTVAAICCHVSVKKLQVALRMVNDGRLWARDRDRADSLIPSGCSSNTHICLGWNINTMSNNHIIALFLKGGLSNSDLGEKLLSFSSHFWTQLPTCSVTHSGVSHVSSHCWGLEKKRERKKWWKTEHTLWHIAVGNLDSSNICVKCRA